MAKNDEFFIHVSDAEKNLHMTRKERITGTVLSPCCMGAEDVEYEMQNGKNTEMLSICGMNQEGLEYFAQHYAGTYRYLNFFKCQLISDFSPLENLPKLERVDIYWNIRTERLWNFSGNTALRELRIMDCKKMTKQPTLLNTAPALRKLHYSGDIFSPYPMDSLSGFADIPTLETLAIHFIRLGDHSMDFLKTLPALNQFDFDAGMLTTEEIARIVAQYPDLHGQSLCAYNKEDAILSDVRICGYKKPGLNLPKQQAALEKYIAKFNALVEQYRQELQ